MKNIKDIEKDFANKSPLKSVELYLDFNNSKDLINECRNNRIAVIGIEGAFIKDKKLELSIDCIADFSSKNADNWDEYYKSLCNTSLNVLNKMHTQYKCDFYTLVLESEYD